MATERLSADDNRILQLERGPVAGHTLKVIVCDRAEPGQEILGPLRERIAERIGSVPRCRQIVKASRIGRPSWVEYAEFGPADQVLPLESAAPLDDQALNRAASALMAERLPRDRPLWRVDVAERLEGGGFALILRTHHAMADGVTTMRMARELFFDQAEAPQRAAAPSSPRPAPRRTARLRATAREIAGMPGTWRRELARGGGASPFGAEVGRRRELAFVAAPLARLKSLGKSVAPHVTLNDVVLTASAGGIARWLEQHGVAHEALRAKVPVSLHNHDHDAHALGNHDSFMFVDLPIAESDPVERLLAINAETLDRKNHHDAEKLDAILRGLHETGAWGRAAERRAMDPRVFTVNISNVPGPRDEITILGGPMRRLMTAAEIAEMHALRISVVSACGQLFFGLCADPDVVPGLAQLAAGIEAEIAELERAAGG